MVSESTVRERLFRSRFTSNPVDPSASKLKTNGVEIERMKEE